MDGELTVDHIVSLSDGGGSGLENLQILCRDCHDEWGGLGIRFLPWPSCAGTVELVVQLEVECAWRDWNAGGGGDRDNRRVDLRCG